MSSEAGKGDCYRRVDQAKWDAGWELAFGGKIVCSLDVEAVMVNDCYAIKDNEEYEKMNLKRVH